MNTIFLTRVRKHFSSDYVSHDTNRSYMRAWVRSVRLLGDRWLLVAPVLRATKGRHDTP